MREWNEWRNPAHLGFAKQDHFGYGSAPLVLPVNQCAAASASNFRNSELSSGSFVAHIGLFGQPCCYFHWPSALVDLDGCDEAKGDPLRHYPDISDEIITKFADPERAAFKRRQQAWDRCEGANKSIGIASAKL